jgi:glyoxylase-like metal-dependent hydrolase (beta-lactamase superfamily II)/rhodanese-related sulfurtransferase
VELLPFATAGLGDTSYLLASEGEAILLDPQRDAWRFLGAAKERGWRITHVLETHVHNDYLSGAREIAAATDAEIVAPARGGYEFEHRPADEGDRLEVGSIGLTAAATPGHTPEHISWFVDDLAGAADDATEVGRGARSPGPVAVFSGGSLLIGTVGRTDLLGPALGPALAADQQRTLQRYAALPDSTTILPTHGAGSFCSAGPVARGWYTSVGAERSANRVFAAAEVPAIEFRQILTEGLGRYPAYYAEMAPMNRRGPRVLGELRLPGAMSPEDVEAAVQRGATIVDGRDRRAFAAAHLPGSINIELDPSFASYVGWLVAFGTPIVLVLPEPAEEAAVEAVTQLLRIGYDWVPGWLARGVDAWRASGRAISTYELVGLREVAEAADGGGTIVDVRQPTEWQEEGVIPGSRQIFIADLPSRIDELPRDRPVTVICASGYRASMAASLLDRADFDVRLVARGGAPNYPTLVAPDSSATAAAATPPPGR